MLFFDFLSLCTDILFFSFFSLKNAFEKDFNYVAIAKSTTAKFELQSEHDDTSGVESKKCVPLGHISKTRMHVGS